MESRPFHAGGPTVSVVGLGAWAIGGSWGEVTEEDGLATIAAAVDAGVTFIDTADVYGDGRSERLIARYRAANPDQAITVATKAGRRLDPHVAERYTIGNLEAFMERSRENLDVDTLDLVQLHCPPTDVYYNPELFEGLDELVADGLLTRYGVSVEKVEEAMKAIEYPGVATVQIIFNAFRQRPAEHFLAAAAERGVGVIVRVPLASGLLTGKMTAESTFAADDHRSFNRTGEAFDVGETFAGVPFEVGLAAVEELRPLVPEGASLAQFALRWIIDHPGVTTVIPGARRPEQAISNAGAADLAPLSDGAMAAVDDVYRRLIKPHVHQRW